MGMDLNTVYCYIIYNFLANLLQPTTNNISIALFVDDVLKYYDAMGSKSYHS